MRIDSIELSRYALPLDPPFHAAWDPQPRDRFRTTIVRIRAGAFEGVGTGDEMPGFAGHEHLFIGQDPLEIERHVRVLDNLQFHYGRMWPIEIAIWDLIGHMRNEPLWRLLGGSSPRVRVYASTGELRNADARAASARDLRDAGFPALKLRFHGVDYRDDIAVVRHVREAIGDTMEIMVDTNQGWRMPWDTSEPWSFETAIAVIEELRDLRVYWVEEPLHRHAYRELAKLRRRGGVRIAGGEGCREYSELLQYLHHGSLDVYQPDVAWSTGVSRACRIAEAAHAAGAMYTPHTWGDGIVLLANLHVAAAVSKAPFVEFPYDPPGWTPARRDFLLRTPIVPDADGYVTLSDAPGLGADIDWQALESLRIE